MHHSLARGGASAVLAALLATVAPPRQAPATGSALARQWIAPTARASAFAAGDAVQVTGFEARVRIQGRIARTTLQVALANPGARAAEAELLLPVPDGAAVTGFDLDGAGTLPSARLLAAPEARAAYDEIVRELRDPGLLEFAGRAAVRSSVFPVPRGASRPCA